MRKKPYQEGDWFAAPIKSGYVLARIARAERRAASVLGYFFEPLRASLPGARDTVGLTASGAFDIKVFIDSALMDGNWPVTHRTEDWRREDWPMPAFGGTIGFIPGLGYRVRYAEGELGGVESTRQVLAEDALQLPEAGVDGQLALERRLKNYFKVAKPTYYPEAPHGSPIRYHGLPDSEGDDEDIDPGPELERRLTEYRERSMAAEAPVAQELAQAGYPVASISELIELGRDGCEYRSAIPILLNWLPRTENMTVRTRILRAASVPWASTRATQALIDEFKRIPPAPSVNYLWDVGRAIRTIADDSFFDAIAEIVADPMYGTARQMPVRWLEESKDPRAVDVLIGLLGDEDVTIPVLSSLGRLKPKRARAAIEPLLEHRAKWWRDTAKKTIERIDEAGE